VRADNESKKFDFNSFVNLTSQGASVYFPQFMYESILKSAVGNHNFTYDLTTVSFPVSSVLEDRKKEGN